MLGLKLKLGFMSGSAMPALMLNFISTATLDPRITFSRGTNGMVTDAAGKLTYAPNNLLLNSDTLSTQSVTTAAISYILSFQGTGSIALSGAYSGSLAGTGVTDRVYLKFTSTAASLTLTVTGSVTSTQLEAVTYQTTPGTYNATTSAAYYGPRFDYDPVTLAAKGLLIEETRSNLCVYSQTPSDANWSATSAAKTSTNNTDPFGTSTALLLTADGLSGTHYVSAGTVSGPSYTSGTTYTISCFVKAGTTNLVQLTAAGATFGSVQYANFSLTGAGSVTASAVGTAVIVAYSGGWYRISLTVPATASAAASAGNLVFITSGTDGRVPTNTSSGTLYVAGWQTEAGSFATSYIPTAASSATRNADVATMTGANFSSWYNASAGTFVWSGDFAVMSSNRLFSVDAGAGARTLDVYLTPPAAIVYYKTSDAQQISIGSGYSVNTVIRLAMAVAFNDYNGAINGTLGGADTATGALAVADRLSIGHWNNSGLLNGHIRSIAYYNSRLPDTTLRSYST